VRHLLMAVLVCVAFGVGACDDDPTLPSDAPVGHTVNKDGVAHMPGLNDPETSCVACHGADLMGGEDGQPSCFSCHGREW
jgi:cytochrome c553